MNGSAGITSYADVEKGLDQVVNADLENLRSGLDLPENVTAHMETHIQAVHPPYQHGDMVRSEVVVLLIMLVSVGDVKDIPASYVTIGYRGGVFEDGEQRGSTGFVYFNSHTHWDKYVTPMKGIGPLRAAAMACAAQLLLRMNCYTVSLHSSPPQHFRVLDLETVHPSEPELILKLGHLPGSYWPAPVCVNEPHTLSERVLTSRSQKRQLTKAEHEKEGKALVVHDCHWGSGRQNIFYW